MWTELYIAKQVDHGRPSSSEPHMLQTNLFKKIKVKQELRLILNLAEIGNSFKDATHHVYPNFSVGHRKHVKLLMR